MWANRTGDFNVYIGSNSVATSQSSSYVISLEQELAISFYQTNYLFDLIQLNFSVANLYNMTIALDSPTSSIPELEISVSAKSNNIAVAENYVTSGVTAIQFQAVTITFGPINPATEISIGLVDIEVCAKTISNYS
ncbi:hypothetical protein HELRODRAFT_183470 [Helobdella robusta]|uniref:Uncharacterized protein n=1 Tax=Helobdella robusta TaxID=6412 RepID=T1FJQ5_HELRO|nr:hypothetical protein HELRODRAFT_183470 [Helobdella robusta]ESO11155.1 hypothetical protein HELRODRAFT_183470 [Helobdella robusta]